MFLISAAANLDLAQIDSAQASFFTAAADLGRSSLWVKSGYVIVMARRLWRVDTDVTATSKTIAKEIRLMFSPFWLV